MKKLNDITGAQMIGPLNEIIDKDILSLNTIKSNFARNDNEKDFLGSLIDAKKQIKETLPKPSAGTQDAVSTPVTRVLKSYADIQEDFAQENVRLADLCLEVENSQRNFIKDQFALKGLPSDLRDSLENALKIYDTIHQHLERTNSTNQLGVIVL